MLTNGFTREEIAAISNGASINCTKTVVMYRSDVIAFSAGRSYEVVSLSDPFMTVIDDRNKQHAIDGLFFRDHFQAGQDTANSKN